MIFSLSLAPNVLFLIHLLSPTGRTSAATRETPGGGAQFNGERERWLPAGPFVSDRCYGPFQKVQKVLLLHGTSGTRSWFRFRISHQQSVNSLHRASDWADGASTSPDGARRNPTSFIKMKLKTSLTHFPSLNSVNDSGGSESAPREEGEKRGRREGWRSFRL